MKITTFNDGRNQGVILQAENEAEEMQLFYKFAGRHSLLKNVKVELSSSCHGEGLNYVFLVLEKKES